MNSREEGFLLLTSQLGDPQRRPLTVPQLRELERCVLRGEKMTDDRELLPADLIDLGCSDDLAEKVVSLLSDLPLFRSYLQRAKESDCLPVTRVSRGYPLRVRKCLGLDAPGCIWLKGNTDLLHKPAVALVGSRNLHQENERFACEVGKLAAKYGLVLISGNARGADLAAQESCLSSGGSVISVIADSLHTKSGSERMLYISEAGFDVPFNNQRALSRNRIIHTMSPTVFVAQCSNGSGGTWDGTCRNLQNGWSTVYCMADGSVASLKLYKMGANVKRAVELDKIFLGLCQDIVNGDD